MYLIGHARDALTVTTKEKPMCNFEEQVRDVLDLIYNARVVARDLREDEGDEDPDKGFHHVWTVDVRFDEKQWNFMNHVAEGIHHD